MTTTYIIPRKDKGNRTVENNDRCPECKNTNGEHKPWCARWTNEARALGLRQCDLEDMRVGEILSRIAAFYGWKVADVLRHTPANHAELGPVELTREVMNSIDAEEDADLKAQLETCLDPDLERLDGIDPNLTNDDITDWPSYDDLSEVIDTIIDGALGNETKAEITKRIAKENGIPYVDVPLSKLNGDDMHPTKQDVEDDGFITVYVTKHD